MNDVVKDTRSRMLAVAAHCLLNQNSKVEGLATYPGVFEPIIACLTRLGIGIIQMRCPEFVHLGPNRPVGTDTREQYNTIPYRESCEEIALDLVKELTAYVQAGYSLLCVLGIEGSPSCSVSNMPILAGSGERVLQPGRGIFMEILDEKLKDADLNVPFVGIPESVGAGDLDAALRRISSIANDAGDT